MDIKTRIKELAAKAEAVTDDTLARLGSPTERHRRLASFLDKKMGLTARERRALDSYRADSLSVVQAINSKLPITMPSFAHTQLAAKAEAVREFARGDYAKKLVNKISHQTSYKERPWVANNLEKSIHEKFGGAQWATADLLRGLRKRHNGFMPRNTIVARGQIESRFESSEAVREFSWPKKVLPMGGGKLHFSRASYDALLARNPSLAKKIAEGSDSKWYLSGVTRRPANDEVRGIFQKYWGQRLQ